MSSLGTILVAEDDETDVLLLQRALKKADMCNPVMFVSDGMACIEALAHAKLRPDERLPALVILDLKMPRRSGFQVLEWMRAEPVIRSIPALVFSSSTNQSDVECAYEKGASGYMIKPASALERAEIATFIKQWLRVIQPPLTASENFKAALSFRAVRQSND